MFVLKPFLLLILVIAVSGRNVFRYKPPQHFIEDRGNFEEDDLEDHLIEHSSESLYPGYLSPRVRRQVHASMNTNPDGSSNVNLKLPLASDGHNALSAIGSVNGAKAGGGYGAAGGGLAYENINGHGLSLTGRHIPNLGDQLTAAGKVNLFHNDDHKLNANAFLTKTMPSNPIIPDFSSHGGSVDYTFKDKVGGSFGISQTPLFQRTDYSALGNVNLYRGRDSSLDFSGGFTKSVSPYIPSSSWQPSAGLSFTKYW